MWHWALGTTRKLLDGRNPTFSMASLEKFILKSSRYPFLQHSQLQPDEPLLLQISMTMSVAPPLPMNGSLSPTKKTPSVRSLMSDLPLDEGSTIVSESKQSSTTEDDTESNYWEDTEWTSSSLSTSAPRETRLQFHKLASIRQEELDALLEGYKQVATAPYSGKHARLCFIHGLSGTGKSALVQQFLSTLATSTTSSSTAARRGRSSSRVKLSKPYVLRGKYEEMTSKPLSALVEALATMSTLLLLQKDSAEEQRIQQRIHHQLGSTDAVEYLAKTFPLLKILLGIPDDDDDDIIAEKNETEGSLPKTKSTMPRRSSFPTTVKEVASSRELVTEDTDDEEPENDSENGGNNHNRELAWNRLQFLFCALIRALASPQRPVILFLDDLQWADSKTWELLQVILKDSQLTHFWLIGSYRSDEVPEESHPLHELASHVDHTTIELKNLSADDLAPVVESTLQIKPLKLDVNGNAKNPDELEQHQRVRDLAKALHDNTQGNLFFTLQVLKELHQKQVLQYDSNSGQWMWDMKQVQAEMSDNVLQSVTQRLRALPDPLPQILTLAAYMRRTIDLESLELMMTMQGMSMNRPALMKLLKVAVKEGFLVRQTSDKSKILSFAHDRIQQAAFEMIPEGTERDQYRQEIGDRLYRTFNFFKSSSSNGKVGTRDWMVLSAADHLNATASEHDNSQFLASLNLEAGRKCMSMAAFESAAPYLRLGLERVNSLPDPWAQQNYKTTFGLYASLAEAELLQGNLQQGREYAEVVMEHAETDMERIPAELALAKALGRERLHKDSFEMSRKTLQSLGKYNKTTAGMGCSITQDLLYVKRYFKTHSDKDILALPHGQNRAVRMEMDLYINTSFQGWMMGSDLQFVASTLKGLRSTLKHGLFPQSGSAIIGYFLICDNLGDREGAIRFANLGLRVLEQVEDKSLLSLNKFVTTFHLSSWSTNNKATVKSYEEAYKAGMAVGDFENGLMSRGAGLDHSYASGYNLKDLDKQFGDLVAKETMYHLESVKGMTTQQWLPTRFLRGTIDIPSNFDDLLDYDKNMRTDGSDNYSQLYAFNSRLQIGVYWGKYDFVLKRLRKYSKDVEDQSHSAMGIRSTFLAIAYGTLYRDYGRKDYLKKAKKWANFLKKESEIRGRNSWHRYLLATAHLQACSKKYTKPAAILKSYDDAIQQARKRGNVQDAALGSQLAFEFLLLSRKKTDDKLSLQHYLEQALDEYAAWGAINLVDYLKVKYHEYVEDVLV